MPKIDSPDESGLAEADLSQAEKDRFALMFERYIEDVRTLDTETTVNKFREYQAEIQQAARVAKAEFAQGFGGTEPNSGQFGASLIRPGFFGYDSWLNCPDAEEGTAVPWLDAAAPDNLSGSAGDPLTVGEDAVHIIIGVGSYVGSTAVNFTDSSVNRELPKTEAVKFRLNDQPRTSIETWMAFRNTDMRQRYFDTPMLVTEDDDVYAEFVGGEAGTEALYPIGVSYVKGKALREIVAADMATEDGKNIVTW